MASAAWTKPAKRASGSASIRITTVLRPDS
jgi:hypothetical protein